MVRFGKWEYTEEDLEKMHAKAVARGERNDANRTAGELGAS